MTSGWRAELRLDFAKRGARTVLADRRSHGPLTVQRPFHPEGDVCHTYVLHPPAGIVGGDELALGVDVGADAHALVTTPAATRWYWSRGVEARVEQHATVAAGATLEWLPQESLLFAGAHARLATRIALAPGAHFLGWEILGFGRPACGEAFRGGRLDFRFELARAGAPMLLERLRGDAAGVAGLAGHEACATFLATDADLDALTAARDVLTARSGTPDVGVAPTVGPSAVLAGATLLGDLLVVRALAARCEPLLATCKRLWDTLRPRLLGRVVVAPRIWNT